MDDVQVSSSYSKRPLWQWILLYVVVGIFLYGLIYYFVFAKKSTYTMQPQQQITTVPSISPTVPTENIYMTKTDTAKGAYLADFTGRTLYTYGKDTQGVSNCTNTCAKIWPPYTLGATAEKNLPTNISVITRADGSKQFTWKGMPLYYYATDTKPGDINGDGVGGVWHIIKL